MAEIVPGSVIASAWRIERLLGRGGMGSVFVAAEVKTGRLVAVKVLEPFRAASEEALTRFKREGEITRGLAHPGVVQVLDAGFDLGHWFLVMELLEGENAEQLLAHAGPLSPERCAALVLPVLDVLELAHAKGVLHRDLKPANVFLSAGPPPSVKVLDFGVSRAGGGATRITRAGVMMGTLCYMAPEQMMDTASSSERSDLYSVGALIFEMISGERAFPGRNDGALIERILTRPPPALLDVVPGVPPALSVLVARLLEKAPARRPASAREVSEALRSIVTPDAHGLFEGFEGAPRRSAVLVADDSDGLGGTFVRPSPKLPPRPPVPQLARSTPLAGAATTDIPALKTQPVAAVARPPASRAPLWLLFGAGLVALGLTAAAHVATALDSSAPILVEPPRPPPRPPAAGQAAPAVAEPRVSPPPAAGAAPIALQPTAPWSKVVPLEQRPYSPCYRVLRDAEMAVHAGTLELARVLLNQCLLVEPHNPAALYLWGNLLTGPAGRSGQRRYFAMVRRYAAASHPVWAELSHRPEPEPEPEHRETGKKQETAGRRFTRDLQWREALKAFTDCTIADPLDFGCELEAANAAEHAKDPETMVAHDLRYLDLAPDDAWAMDSRRRVQAYTRLDGASVIKVKGR